MGKHFGKLNIDSLRKEWPSTAWFRATASAAGAQFKGLLASEFTMPSFDDDDDEDEDEKPTRRR